ncbi:MAG TPA: MSMEG_1061 family FMN-dependent PPOX-type flavoprotein [Stellaceae bacterium]|jgi:hypothetical protein
MDRIEHPSVTTIGELDRLYAPPHERAVKKELDRIDALGRAFIAASPFLVMATGSADGLDCSPKGDEPGFVQVADDGKRLMIPDRPGNNRIDGLRNLVEDSRIALLFFVPGANDTYRVNGRARISAEPALRARFDVDGKEPRTVIVVAVEQAFHHSPKALIRSDLWHAGAAMPLPEGVPTIGDFAARNDPRLDVARFNADYARDLIADLY